MGHRLCRSSLDMSRGNGNSRIGAGIGLCGGSGEGTALPSRQGEGGIGGQGLVQAG